MEQTIKLNEAELEMLKDALNDYGKKKRKEHKLILKEISVDFYDKSREIENQAETYVNCMHKLYNPSANQTKKEGWIREKIRANNQWSSSKKVIVRRFYERNRVVLDFIGNSRCATYDYNGKWIGG